MKAEVISHVLKCWSPRPNGRKMAVRRVGFFATGTANSHFFVTGQISMKFGGWGNVNRCPVLNLNRRILKIYPGLKGWFCPKPPFLVALTVLHITCLQVRGYVFRLTTGRANGVPILNWLYLWDWTISAVQ